MKTIICTVVIVLLVFGLASSQSSELGIQEKGFRVGFGLATMDVSVDGLKDAAEESYAGPVIGFFVNYKLAKSVWLQPELLYVGQGAGGEFLRGRSWRHDYLQLPVLVKYDLTENTKFIPAIYTGVAFSYLLSAEYRSSIISEDIDTKDAAKDFDFSLVVGGALDYRRFTFDLRYTLGLVNVYDNEKWNELLNADLLDYDYMTADDKMKNINLTFTLEYRM